MDVCGPHISKAMEKKTPSMKRKVDFNLGSQSVYLYLLILGGGKKEECWWSSTNINMKAGGMCLFFLGTCLGRQYGKQLVKRITFPKKLHRSLLSN